MMCSIQLVIVLASFAQVCATDLVDQWVDKLIEQLFHSAFMSWPLQLSNQDKTISTLRTPRPSNFPRLADVSGGRHSAPDSPHRLIWLAKHLTEVAEQEADANANSRVSHPSSRRAFLSAATGAVAASWISKRVAGAAPPPLPKMKNAKLAKVPDVRLNDGSLMPAVAFGAQAWDADICERNTALAIQAGYRFIWSAQSVGADCQRAQAKAIKASGIDRSKFFIGGAVAENCVGYQECYDQTLRLAADQFDFLQETYLDMLMLQYPSRSGCANDNRTCICNNVLGQWDAFEYLKAQKKVGSIAVSNFKVPQLDCIRKPGTEAGRTFPSVNQKQYGVGHGKDPLVNDDAKYGIVVQSWSPLQYSVCLPEVDAIAKARGKSATQIALRWIIQRGATICINSFRLDHLQEDLDIFDFTLSDAEMLQLNTAQLQFENCVDVPEGGGPSIILGPPR